MINAAWVKKRSPLYAELPNEEAVVLYCIISGLARHMDLKDDSTPEEITESIESLIHKGFVRIIEDDDGYRIALTPHSPIQPKWAI